MTDCALKTQITDDMKAAMRAKETARLVTIRMLLAAIKQKEVDDRVEQTDSDVLAILNRMIKQRRESAAQFKDAGRMELADKEEQEIVWLTNYLPQQLTDQEIDKLIEDAIQKSGASTAKEMGAVMAILKPAMQGRADMGMVSQKIKSKLN